MSAEPTRLHAERPTIDHADIRWRVSNTWQKGDVKMGMLVGYIDARTCMEALDALDPEWSAVHGDPIIVGQELIGVPCAVTVNGITRSDVGMPSSQEPIKGAYSDALKRAAVHHGVGRELYELPKIAVECEVGRDGKVKAPKATPIYRNGRWTIDRQYGWVKYDREPDDSPEPRSRGASRADSRQPHAGVPSSAPGRTAEEQELLDELVAITGGNYARMELLGKEVGIASGDRANADQLREMIRIAQLPLPTPSGAGAHATPAEPGQGTVEGDGDGIPALVTTPSSEAATSADQALLPPDPGPPAAPTDAEILAAAGEGAELIPPKPGTPEYKALPNGTERAKAKAWHDAKAKAKGEPQQETLAEALGSPVGSDS